MDGSPAEPFVESFWHWKQFGSYLITIGALSTFLAVVTFLGSGQTWLNVTLGTLSSGIEVRKKNKKFARIVDQQT